MTARSKNGEIGYYFFDRNDYRIICTDTNYSYDPATLFWQHNTEASWGAPNGNAYPNSLGPDQLKWLEKLFDSSAEEGKHCLLASHVTFHDKWGRSPDAAAVCEMIRKANERRLGTVIMAIKEMGK